MGRKQRLVSASASATLISLLFVGTVSSARFTSPSYIIDASVNNTFGGQGSSVNYKATTTGGESIVGNGSGGSYKMGAGFISQLDRGFSLAVQPGGLKASYSFDEPSGLTILDGSASANSGRIGSAGGRATGKVGSGLAMNGLNTDAQIPDNTALPTGSNVTVMVWAKQSAAAVNEAFVSQWDYTGAQPVSGAWAVQTSNTDASRVRVFIAAGTADPGNNYVDTPVSSWTTGAWHHVAFTFDGTQSAASRVKVYIDGVEQTGSVTGTIPATIPDAAAALDIGDFHGLDRQLHGALDEVKLFNRTLSAAEVKAEYDAENAGNSVGVHLGSILPGASNTATMDIVTQTDAAGYSLAVSQNQNLTSGGNSIPAMSGSIASPSVWSEGSTKGLGFTLLGTNATALPAKWNSGNSYAAFPSSATSFYARTGYTSGAKDYVNMRLRVDAPSTQTPAAYQNTVTISGTIVP